MKRRQREYPSRTPNSKRGGGRGGGSSSWPERKVRARQVCAGLIGEEGSSAGTCGVSASALLCADERESAIASMRAFMQLSGVFDVFDDRPMSSNGNGNGNSAGVLDDCSMSLEEEEKGEDEERRMPSRNIGAVAAVSSIPHFSVPSLMQRRLDSQNTRRDQQRSQLRRQCDQLEASISSVGGGGEATSYRRGNCVYFDGEVNKKLQSALLNPLRVYCQSIRLAVTGEQQQQQQQQHLEGASIQQSWAESYNRLTSISGNGNGNDKGAPATWALVGPTSSGKRTTLRRMFESMGDADAAASSSYSEWHMGMLNTITTEGIISKLRGFIRTLLTTMTASSLMSSSTVAGKKKKIAIVRCILVSDIDHLFSLASPFVDNQQVLDFLVGEVLAPHTGTMARHCHSIAASSGSATAAAAAKTALSAAKALLFFRIDNTDSFHTRALLHAISPDRIIRTTPLFFFNNSRHKSGDQQHAERVNWLVSNAQIMAGHLAREDMPRLSHLLSSLSTASTTSTSTPTSTSTIGDNNEEARRQRARVLSASLLDHCALHDALARGSSTLPFGNWLRQLDFALISTTTTTSPTPGNVVLPSSKSSSSSNNNNNNNNNNKCGGGGGGGGGGGLDAFDTASSSIWQLMNAFAGQGDPTKSGVEQLTRRIQRWQALRLRLESTSLITQMAQRIYNSASSLYRHQSLLSTLATGIGLCAIASNMRSDACVDVANAHYDLRDEYAPLMIGLFFHLNGSLESNSWQPSSFSRSPPTLITTTTTARPSAVGSTTAKHVNYTNEEREYDRDTPRLLHLPDLRTRRDYDEFAQCGPKLGWTKESSVR